MKLTSMLVVLAMALQAVAGAGAEFDRGEVEREVMAVLDQFIQTFSDKDPVAHVATYHFPHYRLARGEMSVLETAESAVQLHVDVFKRLAESGWVRSIWVHRRIVTLGATKVHVDTRFRRLDANGREIGTFDSLYILIRKDGRWGVKMRSSYA